MTKFVKPFIIIVCLTALISCAPETKTQKGAVYGAAGGAAAGAIIGQIIGKDTKGTLIGAAIGAAVGGAGGAAVGRMMDNQERDMREALAASEAAAVRREGDLLAISLKGDVTFDTNSAIVKPGLYSEIDRIAEVLVKYPDTVIRVEGHTDSTGSESYNMDLSGRRAEAVKNLIVQKGVDPSRLQTMAFGESAPIATNDTPEGRARNRRVEIKVAPTEYESQAY
ncbi:MAG: OmpA family protein [Nitrospiraceae bacterium]|nr:MAG: OmpA family protein [Nitrospiraceae bacterium]